MRCNLMLILLLSSIMGYSAIYDLPAFQISKEKPSFQLLDNRSNITITSDTSIILDCKRSVSGIGISGKTILKNSDALVRVLLFDKKGKEYLLFEDIFMFPDDNIHEFSNVAMETALLENIEPLEIKIYIQDAQMEINQICATIDNELCPNELKENRQKRLAAQEQYWIDRWNSVNYQTGQFWIAGKTSISGRSYSDKKRLLGATSDHFLSDGMEYYTGGFFVVKAHEDSLRTENNTQTNTVKNRNEMTTYVESFDWRNRHGKNWMTSVKNQNYPVNYTGSGGCWIFGPVAALESHLNLYYNRLLNYDLSEQAVGSCSSQGSMLSGGLPFYTYDYIQQNGLVTEECFPFQNSDTLSCDSMCSNPEEIIQISTYNYYNYNADANTLKWELINNGPIASGIFSSGINHVMCLCGYGTIHAGDHINYVHPHSAYIDTIIPANSNLVGKTYWIYKDSRGTGVGDNGYMSIVFKSDITRDYTTALYYPVSVSTLSTDDIVCADADNDGYYFWGLGPKPNNCPVCCPDTPDGDDSNPLLAEMDAYGNFAAYTFPYATATINSNTTWNTNRTECGNIIVTNNATLTITAELTMNPAAKIIVEDGGKLIVDGGVINNATVDILSSASIQLLHNGTLYLKQNGNLNVRLGAEADMEYGRVLLQ